MLNVDGSWKDGDEVDGTGEEYGGGRGRSVHPGLLDMTSTLLQGIQGGFQQTPQLRLGAGQHLNMGRTGYDPLM